MAIVRSRAITVGLCVGAAVAPRARDVGSALDGSGRELDVSMIENLPKQLEAWHEFYVLA